MHTFIYSKNTKEKKNDTEEVSKITEYLKRTAHNELNIWPHGTFVISRNEPIFSIDKGFYEAKISCSLYAALCRCVYYRYGELFTVRAILLFLNIFVIHYFGIFSLFRLFFCS